MNDDDLIADAVERLFSEQVGKSSREAAERGELDAALWQQVADAGLPLMLAAERDGGLGLPLVAAWPLLRGIGHWQVPLPLAETLLAAQLLSRAGLPVPGGPLTLAEQGLGGAVQVQASGGAVLLTGTLHHVPWARHAQALALSLDDGRVALVDLRESLADGAAAQVLPHVDTAGLPDDTVELRGARAVAVAPHGLALAQPAWTLGAVARSAMMAGALQWTLAQTATYANERVQFGKPIGRNQALQQNLALVAGDTAAATMAARVALADADGPSARFSAAVAKVRAGEAATRATGIAHQVHGAIGFTQEHALHFATRRLWAWRAQFGSDAWWAAELGRSAIAAGGSGFWTALTQRRFDTLDINPT